MSNMRHIDAYDMTQRHDGDCCRGLPFDSFVVGIPKDVLLLFVIASSPM